MVEIIQIEIKKLTLLENNPRRISKDQMDSLCKSIQNDPNFLFNRPILVHENNGLLHVYAGNQRVRAAKKLKWKTIPAIIEKDLSEEIIKQRIIKDNKTYGEFDFDLLANEFDIETLLESGFTPDELVGCVQEIDTEVAEDKKEEKVKSCPNCGHQL